MHHIPFVMNLVILAPVLAGLIRHRPGAPIAALGGVADVPLLRLLLVSLWGGVFVLSALALLDPLRFWPLLAFQLIYKAAFLALYCVPVWAGKQQGPMPQGLVVVFVLIIALWPIFIVKALQSGQM